jgi:hypothetical protein
VKIIPKKNEYCSGTERMYRWAAMNTIELGDQIATLAAQLEAGEYRLITKIGEFDSVGGWHQAGALSCAHWLSWRIGLAPGAAREKVRVARVLTKFPKIAKAFEEAKVSYSKVRAMTRVATPENEELLLQIARSTTASILEELCRKFRTVLERSRDDESPEEADSRRSVRHQHLADGRMRFTIDLAADEGPRFLAAVERATFEQGEGDVPAEMSPAEKRRRNKADGVMIMTESFLAGGPKEGKGGNLCEVRLHVTREQVEQKTAGAFIENAGITAVSAETARRLCCDAAIVEVTEDSSGKVLDIGRRSRTIPAAIRRAIEIRDQNRCAFPACTNTRFLDAHHMVHWVDGGETSAANTCLLCRRHHRFTHEHGYRVVLGEDGLPVFTAPSGKIVSLVPEPAISPSDTIETLAEEHAARGLELDELTLIPPDYDGDPADPVWIVDVLSDVTFPRNVRPPHRRSTKTTGRRCPMASAQV